MRQSTIIALSSLCFANVAATNLTQCLDSVRNGAFGTGMIGATDSRGNILEDVREATGLTYQLCKTACGPGQEPFQWSVFSQQFSSWLLPWLALISQLPFGPTDRLDNLKSVSLTLGSPMLAAYSLALTVLNGRWITRRLSKHKFPNVRNASRVLVSLQQAPLRVTNEAGLLASLVVLPQNDEWWGELIEWLEYTHTWSISAVTSIAWVIIAYIFTLIDSFTGDIATTIGASGQGLGSLWLWLLPIVVGWLQISPKCDQVRLTNAVGRANKLAYLAAEMHPFPVRQVTELRAVRLAFDEEDSLRSDERNTAPIYNYARFLPWVEAVEMVSETFRAASDRYLGHQSVDPSIEWVTTDKGPELHDRNRTGSNEQVIRYCDPLGSSSNRSSRMWGPDVVSRMIIASLMAFLLQWGTVGAAIIIVYFTPTKGLGCRSASYVLFGVLSTVVWALHFISSLLAHYVSSNMQLSYGKRPRTLGNHWPSSVARRLAILFRHLGQSIAAANAFWIVAVCLFQFSNFFDRCYCNSSVLGWRGLAYTVISLQKDDLYGMTIAWVGGACLAGGTAIIFLAFVNVLINPPLPEKRH